VDGMTDFMPPQVPLEFPTQDLRAPYTDRNAPALPVSLATYWRIAAFVPAIVTTVLLSMVFLHWFSAQGLSSIEIILTALISLSFFWICFSLSTASVGLINALCCKEQTSPPAQPVKPLDVALLVPIYNEAPWDVFGNATAMLEDLNRQNTAHRYSIFILSDTQDPAIAAQEEMAFARLRRDFGPQAAIYYRRRPNNTDRKIGNLSDWITHWGGAYEAMLTLDADSLMSASAIIALSDALSADASAGLIQSAPQVFGASSLFGRAQQFSSVVYGALLSQGLAKWADREGNYWGHNAIIRTAAFASCAGLPRLRSLRAENKLIMSHDFVEASLLRRAGWGVRFLPHIKGSYEETPQTVIDYVLRDRRWCQGNLQHLRLLMSRGFHAVSRFHLLHGAISYLLSPIWFTLLTFWALVGNGRDSSVLSYFSEANPLMPTWPEMSVVNGFWVMIFMYSMLLAPKFMGMLTVHFVGYRLSQLGGLRRFLTSFLIELVISIAYAPIMMVQQMIAVLRTTIGIRDKWNPQRREAGRYGLLTLIKFHILETITGAALLTAMALGLVSLWLLPIAVSLVLAVPLSALSGLNLSRWTLLRDQLGTPEVFDTPEVIKSALNHRAVMKKELTSPTDKIAAE
jgi:membrane glycosyltransferase